MSTPFTRHLSLHSPIVVFYDETVSEFYYCMVEPFIKPTKKTKKKTKKKQKKNAVRREGAGRFTGRPVNQPPLW
jgi:hypothetical protein